MEDEGKIDISCYNVKKGEKQLPRVLAGENYVAVEVRDYGSGISSEVMRHIFEPYFTTKKHGSGLGLAVCHSIVSRHDGLLTIRVPEGKGISFLFYLPAAEAELIKEEPTSEPILSAEKKQIILIMDDDIIVCEILRDMLDFMGYETVLTYSGEEALSVYSERAQSGDDGIDLVIMWILSYRQLWVEKKLWGNCTINIPMPR